MVGSAAAYSVFRYPVAQTLFPYSTSLATLGTRSLGAKGLFQIVQQHATASFHFL